MMQAQRYGYTQMINNAIADQLVYKLRLAHRTSRCISREIGMDMPGLGLDARQEALARRSASGRARAQAIETIMGATDYLEQYFAVNVMFEPMVGELFRCGFLMQAAAAQTTTSSPRR